MSKKHHAKQPDQDEAERPKEETANPGESSADDKAGAKQPDQDEAVVVDADGVDIVLTRDTMIAGKAVRADQKARVSKRDARQLIWMDKARKA